MRKFFQSKLAPNQQESAQVLERLLLSHRDAAAVNELTTWLIFLKWSDYGRKLSAPERHVIAINDLIQETLNGGFHQFFSNSSGQFANDVLPALEAIGETHLYSIYQDVLTLYFAGSSVPLNCAKRLGLIEANSDRSNFEELEEALHQRFNSMFESESYHKSIVNRIVEYISTNREAFSFTESVYRRWLRTELAETFPADAAYKVRTDGDVLRVTGPHGDEKQVQWSLMREIAIVKHGKSRTGLFPWEGPKCPYSGYSWKFTGTDPEVAVPFHASFDQKSVDIMFAMDGFELTCLIEQERSLLAPTGTQWICWKRTAACEKH